MLMLGKAPFEENAKASFIKSITEDFYKEHIEFLSVPLLATSMMMTYGQFASVPERIFIFYEQAFHFAIRASHLASLPLQV